MTLLSYVWKSSKVGIKVRELDEVYKKTNNNTMYIVAGDIDEGTLANY